MLRNDRELLAVRHCRGKNDRIVIMDITPTSKLHQYWCFSEAGDQSPT